MTLLCIFAVIFLTEITHGHCLFHLCGCKTQEDNQIKKEMILCEEERKILKLKATKKSSKRLVHNYAIQAQ